MDERFYPQVPDGALPGAMRLSERYREGMPPPSPAGMPPAALEPFSQAEIRFSMVESVSPDFLELQKLRYQVYCLERRFLDPASFPDGLERDAYDPYSIHFGAWNESHEAVATMRLVLYSHMGFPLERHASDALFPEARLLMGPHTAEISRLIVEARYRRSAPGRAPGASPYPAILFGLLREMYRASLLLQISHWLAGMETPLWRMLRLYGFAFAPIGRPIEYYGSVGPYAGDVREIERITAAKRPEVLRYFLAAP